MEIKRNILQELVKWKDREDRRPLVLQGARQIGKTWVVKKFGTEYFKYTAYFNFDANIELGLEFKKTKDVKRLIDTLSLYCDVPLLPNETLIFFDEIQECPEALNALKYFCEDLPEFHVVAAGSLLGVALHKEKGFPVGKVDFLQMFPLSFDEYFGAYNERFASILESCKDLNELSDIPEIIKSTLEDAFRHYRICGGMPKAAVISLKREGNERIELELRELLNSFMHDFSKHAPTSEFPRISYIWRSLPSQLAKENRKFIYKVVKPGARAREYEGAINWLREAGLIYQIYCISKPGLPISAYDDISAFKVYLLDCGLLRALSQMPAELYVSENPGFVEFKGALAENMVLQQLLVTSCQMPRYWVSNGTAEVDFIMQSGLEIIPIEVKAGKNMSGKSLSVYIQKFKPSRAIVVSEKEFGIKQVETEIIHLPFSMLPWGLRLISAQT